MRNLHLLLKGMALLFLCSTSLLFSCSVDEDVLLNALNENDPPVEQPGTPDEGTPPDGDQLEISTTPCDFKLEDAAANSTVTIDCKMDLDGRTVKLPSNVNLEFNGGEIINGTLDFSGGTIDGKLLNYQLDVKGSVTLKEDNFFFYPDRWNIVQGKTTDAKALSNKVNIRKAMDLVHTLGGTIFSIDKMDAYFDVHIYLANAERQAMESILLPKSNFHLKMTGNTYMRVQPNGAPAYNLVSIFEGTNIKITGGNLLGDRWEHDYSPVNDIVGRPRNSHGWGHVLKVIGGKNILIEDVYIANAAADNFGVHGSDIRNADGTPGNSVVSENVTMRNCTLEAARRNGMSILDGKNILIENCKILDTGKGPVEDGIHFGTGGTSPRYGVSFEAYRERTETGELKEYNKIEHVILRGNTFTGNYAGDIVLFTCSDITIDNNFFDSRIANKAAHNVIISNNTMKARINEDGTPYNYGINLQSNVNQWDGEFTYNYTIFGNTIEGYGNAMILAGKDYKVYDNKFINNKNALGIENLDEGDFHDNEFNSNIPYSIAYFSRGGILKNVNIKDDIIKVDYRPLNFRSIEASSASPLKITGCELISLTKKANFIENSKYITITNNVINTDITVNNSQNIVIQNNSSN